MPSVQTNAKSLPGWVLLVAMLGVPAVFAGLWYWLPKYVAGVQGPGDRAEVLSALFGALAFAGVIAAILLQKRELELQRHELDETQRLLEDQREEMAAQVAMLRRQSFESTFFELVRVLRELDDPTQFGLVISEVADQYRSFRQELSVPEAIDRAYERRYPPKEAILGPYLRTLYHILRFIDEINLEDKARYARFLRAQLSPHQLLLVFYNGLSFRAGKLPPLVVAYALLKHLSWHLLIEPDHRFLWDPAAFGLPDDAWRKAGYIDPRGRW